MLEALHGNQEVGTESKTEGADEQIKYSLGCFKTNIELTFSIFSRCMTDHSEPQPFGYVPGLSKLEILTGHKQDISALLCDS